jgi:hypothetical protein
MHVPEDVLDQPLRRRWWLLLRALESQPLDEALKAAQAAEDFLTGNGALPAQVDHYVVAPALESSVD